VRAALGAQPAKGAPEMELMVKGAEYIYRNTRLLRHYQSLPKRRRRVLRSGSACPIMAFFSRASSSVAPLPYHKGELHKIGPKA
jgi:hypothetical protein